MKKYVDIPRIKEMYSNTFEIGEPIVIEEKIDFSNAQICMKKDEFKFSSRRRELNPAEDTFNGFTELGNELNKEVFNSIFGERYIIFGEWAGNPHTIKYPDNVKKKFWVFDIWDIEKEQYLPYTETRILYDTWLKADSNVEKYCPFVPVFYVGNFEGWDKIKKLVGKTELRAEPCGEGIVIKRQSILSKELTNSHKPAYVKWVSDNFSEVQKVKKISPEAIAQAEKDRTLVSSVVTSRRIEKQLEKAIEDNLIPQDWNVENMKDIAKILPTAVYQDCVKEEPEIVEQVKTFSKICGSITMECVRKMLNKKNMIV